MSNSSLHTNISFHPNILERDWKKEFVVLPYDEFLRIQEELEDFDSFKMLRVAKELEGNSVTINFGQAKKELDID